MRAKQGHQCWLLVAIVVASAPAASGQEQRVTIPFDLPNGLSFEERATHVQELQAAGAPEIQRTQTSTRFSVRVNAEGYTIVQRPGDMNGRPSSDMAGMVNMVMANSTLSWDLDARGRLMRVRGYEAMVEQLVDAFSNALRLAAKEEGLPWNNKSGAALLDRMLAPIGFSTSDPSRYLMQQWNARQILGFQAGVSVPLNVSLQSRDNVPTVSGPVAIIRISKVSIVPCGTRRCVRIIQASSTESDAGPALTEMARGMLGGALNYLGGGTSMPKDLGYRDVKIDSDLVREMDLETGMTVSDMNGREISMTVVSPDGRSPVKAKTTSYYAYIVK